MYAPPERGEAMTKEEYDAIISDYVDIICEEIDIITNGNIKLSDDDLMSIEFMIRRFSMMVVESALGQMQAAKPEEFIPTLRRLCMEKYRETYGVK